MGAGDRLMEMRDFIDGVTEDSRRDFCALVMALLQDDGDGLAVVLANCDPQAIARTSVYASAAVMTFMTIMLGREGDLPFIRHVLAAGLSIDMPGSDRRP
jgi:hypothetical protein